MVEQVPMSQRNLEGFLGITSLDKPREYANTQNFGVLKASYTEVILSRYHFAARSLRLTNYNKIFELHIVPFIEQDGRDRFLALDPFEKLYLARKSLQAIAQYVDDYNLDPHCFIGVTHGAVGSVAQRVGFNILNARIPAEYRDRLQDSYENFRQAEFEHNPLIKAQRLVEPAALVYLPKDEFMEKFWKPRQVTNLVITP